MKRFTKYWINGLLNKFGLKIVKSRLEHVSFTRLFDDLKFLIDIEFPLVLDVGANVGQTIDEIQSVFKKPIIHSFEPSESTFAELKSTKFNGGGELYLYNYALGDKIQQKKFINYEWSTLSSFLTLDDNLNNRFREISIDNKEIVDVDTIDNFVTTNKIKQVDLLKIDTQGFDLNVLKGAIQSLENNTIKYVQIEINFVAMYNQQSTYEDIFKFLEQSNLFLISLYEIVRENNNTISWCTALFGRRKK